MIATHDRLYLQSMPKCASTATAAALAEMHPGATTQIGAELGHSRAWAIPADIRARRIVWGGVVAPAVWYRRLYLHAVDTRSPATLEGLRAYGGGRLDYRSVLYGLCHPHERLQPEQAGLIWRVPEPCAAVDLATRGIGLWSWALGYWFGARCPSPGESAGWGVDILADGLQPSAAASEAMGEPVTVPRRNVRQQEIRTWCAEAAPDDAEMMGWIEAADGAMAAALGWPLSGPLLGGACVRL